MPSVLTRETWWSPPPYQATNIPFGSEIRLYRRVLQKVSLVIKYHEGTSSVGPAPIEREFLFLSTLVLSPLVRNYGDVFFGIGPKFSVAAKSRTAWLPWIASSVKS